MLREGEAAKRLTVVGNVVNDVATEDGSGELLFREQEFSGDQRLKLAAIRRMGARTV